jgi:hypothetical protein
VVPEENTGKKNADGDSRNIVEVEDPDNLFVSDDPFNIATEQRAEELYKARAGKKPESVIRTKDRPIEIDTFFELV